MTNQWTSTEIARMESRRFLWRDAKLVVLPLAPVWFAMAVMGLIVGLSWRVLPQATAPNLYALLDVCGLVLWLAGWRVAEAVTEAMQRRRLHLINPEEALSRLLFVGLALGGSVVALALAPSGLLLAYSPLTILQTLSTQDIAQINVNLGGLWAATLLLGGSLCVITSCCAALLVQGLGRLAPLAWLVVGCYAQLSTLGGLSEHIRRLDPGGSAIFSWVPPTLGILARNTMAKLADPGIRYEYANPLADSSVLGGLLALIVFVCASLWVAGKQRRTIIKADCLPLAACGAVACMGTYVLGKLWVYTTNPGVASPGNWSTVVTLGPLSCMLLYWLWNSRAPGIDRNGLLWPLMVVASSIAFTTPQLRAGMGSQAEVGWQALLLLGPLLLTTKALLPAAGNRQALLRIWPLIAFTLLAIPLHGRDSLISLSRLWALEGTNSFVAAGVVVLLLLAAVPQYVGTRRRVVPQSDLRPAI